MPALLTKIVDRAESALDLAERDVDGGRVRYVGAHGDSLPARTLRRFLGVACAVDVGRIAKGDRMPGAREREDRRASDASRAPGHEGDAVAGGAHSAPQ